MWVNDRKVLANDMAGLFYLRNGMGKEQYFEIG